MRVETRRKVLRDRFVSTSIQFVHQLDGLIAWASRVGNPPVFKTQVFPWATNVENNWMATRLELDEILKKPNAAPPFQDITPEVRSLTNDDGWKSYFLYIAGNPVPRSCAECPETARVLKGIPGLVSAFFSILEPGKHLPMHRGLTKGFIRYHLPLLVPTPAETCRIQVDGRTYYWKEGESFIFDDTCKHEVWNDSDSTRVVLFVDFIRPMRFPVNVLAWTILWVVDHSPYVGGVMANYQAWEERMLSYRQD